MSAKEMALTEELEDHEKEAIRLILCLRAGFKATAIENDVFLSDDQIDSYAQMLIGLMAKKSVKSEVA